MLLFTHCIGGLERSMVVSVRMRHVKSTSKGRSRDVLERGLGKFDDVYVVTDIYLMNAVLAYVTVHASTRIHHISYL